MTPKSLLRLPQATSHLERAGRGPLPAGAARARGRSGRASQRLILCSGKIYYDLVGHADRAAATSIAIARVELLYPFPQGEVLKLVESYPKLREVVWVQEEPRNMGARAFMSPRLLQILPEHLDFGYIGRHERAASGEGYPIAHALEQNRIVSTALDVSEPVSKYPRKLPGER